MDGERHNIMRRSLAVKDGGMKYGDLKEVSLGGGGCGVEGRYYNGVRFRAQKDANDLL